MKIKEKQAISLIVLVITILVLSILAATVIISLSNTNVISEANDAVKKTEAQQIEEAKTLMYADGMLGNTPEDIVIGDVTLKWDEESQTVIEVKPNTIKEGVTIPSGFYYVGGTKDTGLVISDNSADENKGVDYTCIGNQFVWVPVEYTATGETDANGLDTGFTAVFKRGTAEKNSDGIYKMTGELDYDAYIEPYADGYSTEVEDYYEMCKSVEKHNGFYIARFEAGDGDVAEKRTNVTEAHTVVSKKDVFVYNCVPWGDYESDLAPSTVNGVENVAGAVYLSQNMYKDSASVVSTLCYGVQWDATLNFVSNEEHVLGFPKSRRWGNYNTSYGAAKVDCGYDNMNYKTGRNEAWKANNIYDLAGNVMEWTFEALSEVEEDDVLNYRYSRGGSFATPVYGGEDDVSNREAWELDPGVFGYNAVGFRVTLYLK